MIKACTFRSSRPKFQLVHFSPAFCETNTPSSIVPANSVSSLTKLGEIASAETMGEGGGKSTTFQLLPPRLERKMPPGAPANTSPSWLKAGESDRDVTG